MTVNVMPADLVCEYPSIAEIVNRTSTLAAPGKSVGMVNVAVVDVYEPDPPPVIVKEVF